MPTHRMNCRVCGAEHSSAPGGMTSAPGGKGTCPYEGLPYPELRAGHDQLYFGPWRKMEATRLSIQQARHRLERHLRSVSREAAARPGISRVTLWRRMKQLGIR